MGEQSSHHTKLVIAGKEEGLFGEGCTGITGDDGEVFDDGGEAVAGEQVFPDVGGFVSTCAIRIDVGWVALPWLCPLLRGRK